MCPTSRRCLLFERTMSLFLGRVILFLVVAIQMKNSLSFECSNNVPLSYDGGHRIVSASGALTCSWVLLVPDNYTIKLTIMLTNIVFRGNINCNHDFLQIRDGANSSGTLLGRLCRNSHADPSVFRSSGTRLWVEYKSTEVPNHFEGFFTRVLNQSFCPSNVISNGTSGSLTSPSYPENFPNDLECSWNLTGPADSRLVLLFRFLCLGICTNFASRCACDSLTISDVFKAREICPETELIPFISIGNRISLTFVTDAQYTSEGFLAEYESVSLHRGCSQMTQLTNTSGWFSSPGFPSNYPGNVQCGWKISIPSGYKIYLTFLEFDIEDCGASCTCDYVEVSLVKSQSKEKRCGSLASGGWLVRNVINDDIVVTFKSDSQGSGKGFEAMYSLIPQHTWDSVPSAFCPEKDPVTTTVEAITVHDSEDSSDSMQTGVAGRSPEVSTYAATAVDPTTKGNFAGGERGDWRSISSSLAIWAFVVLYRLPG